MIMMHLKHFLPNIETIIIIVIIIIIMIFNSSIVFIIIVIIGLMPFGSKNIKAENWLLFT